MAKSSEKQQTPSGPGTNPDVYPEDGGINPSAPSVGTEGWGTTSDERRVLTQSDPAHTRAGQQKGNPGDKQAEGSERASNKASTAQQPDENDKNKDSNQADLSRLTSASAYSMNTSHDGQGRTFRCADAGNADCRWETSGDTDDEIVQRAEEHGKKDHGMSDWTEGTRSKVRDAIRHREAA